MKSKRILVVAPHPDDETLALGGTIAKYSEQGYEIHVLVVSGHLPPLYKRKDFEKTVTEAKQAFDILGVSHSKFLEIPATMINDFPVHELNNMILQSVNDLNPLVGKRPRNTENNSISKIPSQNEGIAKPIPV